MKDKQDSSTREVPEKSVTVIAYDYYDCTNCRITVTGDKYSIIKTFNNKPVSRGELTNLYNALSTWFAGEQDALLCQILEELNITSKRMVFSNGKIVEIVVNSNNITIDSKVGYLVHPTIASVSAFNFIKVVLPDIEPLQIIIDFIKEGLNG